jgi:organic hydroperoxide reductase OsmC/OhrA
MRLEVRTDLDRADAEALVERAKAYCFVSRTLLAQPDIEYVVVD